MNNNSVDLKILKIVSLVAGINIEKIILKSNLSADLDFEDYHYVDMLVRLEDEFKTPFKLQKIMNLKTVEDLLECVKQSIR